ncbi:MAG: TatD family hydrolase [Candidatus Thiodiazotropha weberae]|uniref:Deoxyribonuclease n=1 Tax=Candidatus Thiodiazotropha endoloripes TaxID=1818881 RepID=A0A1E2UTH7_9GAMM|nr:TatD family hydrolase [Candidatus Thiodiazotropha endoloripes]MCG7900092.1 TatD family hydrolase [Candidatus Thiodiazotropha weberae]MCG7901492.1 TatD family hydrolase [Candidatus Thiodiazotropha weberae]MCG7913770.1 TatD family hydrolase [Candidatus Thiodiazotropha weberae]ODB85121.1 deoxyribonuclease [Candidatus Thiodiazotropha endoloripes]ODB86842.1 deoxyribonuclease [Candidatus Thiodiazotropha endoloripes]
MLVDSHCHLDRVALDHYANDFGQFVSSTLDGGISHMLCVSIDLESWPSMVSLVESYPQISVSVGVHPNDRERHDPSPAELVELAQHPKVVAIGETGLDYFHGKGDLDWQRNRFRQHIEAAKQAKLPLIIHTRDAREDTLSIMQSQGADQAGGVMHCFTENWSMAERAIEMGFFISFSGIITFKNAADLREVVKRVPMQQLLIETDSPYLAPVPYRGKPNQPIYVHQVAECVAEIKGLGVEEVAVQTTENYYRCFPLAAH